jgi:hypothetical protein
MIYEIAYQQQVCVSKTPKKKKKNKKKKKAITYMTLINNFYIIWQENFGSGAIHKVW